MNRLAEATEIMEIKACNVPVDSEGVKRIRELQDEFKRRTNGGRITQTRLASMALKKLTIADLLPA